MAKTEPLQGRYVDLRSCTIADAEFTLAIRQVPKYSKAIPRIDGTIEQQKKWIEKQISRTDDYFFVIWDKGRNRIGTIGLYDLKDDYCESGRIVVEGNPFQCIEAQLLLDDFGFNVLNLNKIISYIYSDNDRALRFSIQFGGYFDEEPIYRDGRQMLKKTNTKETYFEARKKLVRMIYR